MQEYAQGKGKGQDSENGQGARARQGALLKGKVKAVRSLVRSFKKWPFSLSKENKLAYS